MVHTYSEMQDIAFYTVKECTKQWSGLIWILVVGGSLFAITSYIFLFKWDSVRSYIRQNKLQEHYQKWKKINKGL